MLGQVGGWFPNPSKKYDCQNWVHLPQFSRCNTKCLSCHHLVVLGSVFWESKPQQMSWKPSDTNHTCTARCFIIPFIRSSKNMYVPTDSSHWCGNKIHFDISVSSPNNLYPVATKNINKNHTRDLPMIQFVTFLNLSQKNWLVVSTHLKNISQCSPFPQVGVKKKRLETTTKKRLKTRRIALNKCKNLGVEKPRDCNFFGAKKHGRPGNLQFCWWPFWDGYISDPNSKANRDLHLGDKKVTKNHLQVFVTLCEQKQKNPQLVGGNQPIWKILVKSEHFPPVRLKIKNVWNHHLSQLVGGKQPPPPPTSCDPKCSQHFDQSKKHLHSNA